MARSNEVNKKAMQEYDIDSMIQHDSIVHCFLFVVGPPYTFRFRVKFYTSDPQNLHDELTRYLT